MGQGVMHEMMILLLALAAAPVQAASAAVTTSPDLGARRSLWQARHSGGILEQAAVDGSDSDASIDSYAIRGNIHHRQLQHGTHQAFGLPFCSVCRFHGKTILHTFKKGHCRKMGQLFTCVRRKTNTNVFTSRSGFAGIPPSRNSTSQDSPEVLVAVQVADGDASTVVAGVGCFRDSDCELSANTLAPMNGTTLASRRGVVTGECVGIVREEDQPGVCFCAYIGGAVDGGDAELAERNATMVSGPEGTSRASQVRNAGDSKSDICVRRSLMNSASIVTASGSPRLMNRTATGMVMLDVELREIELNDADDNEYSEDEEAEGFTILSSGTDFTPDEMIEYDDAPGTVLPPRPPPPRSPNRTQIIAPASSSAPARFPTSSPRSTPAREAATPPTPATTPAPSTVDDTPTRGRGSRANRQAVISEEIDISMRFQDT